MPRAARPLFITALSFTLAVAVLATAPAALAGLRAGPWPGPPEDAALAYAGTLPASSSRADLVVERVTRWRGVATVYLRQLRHGVPVVRGQLVVRVDADGWVRGAVDTRMDARGAEAGPRAGAAGGAGQGAQVVGPVEPVGPAAARRALEAALSRVASPPSAVEVGTPRLWWEPAVHGGRLMWRASGRTTRPPVAWRLELDAVSGHARRPIPLGHGVQGRVYPKSPANSDPTLVDLLDLVPGATTLVGTRAFVLSQRWVDGQEQATTYASPDAAGDFVFEPDPAAFEDPFAEVNAYYQITRISRWFEEHVGLSLELPARVLVNYAQEPGGQYLNAYAYTDPSTGRFMVVAGQADEYDFAYDGMTLAHEFGHPVFDLRNDIADNNLYPINTDAQGFHPAPQGMNEGASDYWAATSFDDPDVFAFFPEDQGQSSLSPRAVKNTMRCPDDVWGEAHLDAPLASGTFWAVREALGAEAGDEVVYAALGQLSDSPTFEELAGLLAADAHTMAEQGVVSAAAAAQVDAAMETRGVIDCGRTLALRDGEPRTVHILGADMVGLAMGASGDICPLLRNGEVQLPPAFSFRVEAPPAPADLPPGATLDGLKLTSTVARADGAPLGEDDTLFRVLLRRGEPVSYKLVDIPWGPDVFQVPIGPKDFDLDFPDSPAEVFIPSSKLALPGWGGGDEPYDEAPWYVALLATNCPTVSHTLTATWVVTEPPPAPEPDPDADAAAAPDASGDTGAATADAVIGADAAPAAAPDGGCQGGGLPRSGGGLTVLGLLGLLALRRRRAGRA